MSFFYTERRIEDLLERETRMIPGPAGELVSVRAFKAFWRAYFFLVFFGIYSATEIAELAQMNSERAGISFVSSLRAIVWDTNDEARRRFGIDCFAIRPAPLKPHR